MLTVDIKLCYIIICTSTDTKCQLSTLNGSIIIMHTLKNVYASITDLRRVSAKMTIIA